MTLIIYDCPDTMCCNIAKIHEKYMISILSILKYKCNVIEIYCSIFTSYFETYSRIFHFTRIHDVVCCTVCLGLFMMHVLGFKYCLGAECCVIIILFCISVYNVHPSLCFAVKCSRFVCECFLILCLCAMRPTDSIWSVKSLQSNSHTKKCSSLAWGLNIVSREDFWFINYELHE